MQPHLVGEPQIDSAQIIDCGCLIREVERAWIVCTLVRALMLLCKPSENLIVKDGCFLRKLRFRRKLDLTGRAQLPYQGCNGLPARDILCSI
jgi:hypothetical protein